MDSDAAIAEMLREPAGKAGELLPKQAIAKVSYTHADMIDCIIGNPGISQGALAARYGYSQSWVCQVMSSDAFQSALAARRTEIVDPVLTASVDEKFKAITNRSLERLMEKLDAPQVSDQVVLRAVELGAKAMGVGGHAPAPPPAADHLAAIANRLLDLQSKVRNEAQGVVIHGQAREVRDDAEGQDEGNG